jgi:4-diphosphocytidyl-2C-methyl-D-erythritol kinase
VQVLLSEGTRISKYLYNSLEESVLARCYWSDTAKSAIESYGYQASVSGSGPSVFTVAPNEHQARDLVSKLRAHGLRAFAHHPSDLACQLVAHEG